MSEGAPPPSRLCMAGHGLGAHTAHQSQLSPGRPREPRDPQTRRPHSPMHQSRLPVTASGELWLWRHTEPM